MDTRNLLDIIGNWNWNITRKLERNFERRKIEAQREVVRHWNSVVDILRLFPCRSLWILFNSNSLNRERITNLTETWTLLMDVIRVAGEWIFQYFECSHLWLNYWSVLLKQVMLIHLKLFSQHSFLERGERKTEINHLQFNWMMMMHDENHLMWSEKINTEIMFFILWALVD